MSIQRVIELQQELSKSNDRVKELEAVVSSQAKEIKGRLKFGNSKNAAPFPSMIVIFNSITKDKEDR